jgi:outer membrane cobalamin receptor
MFRQLCAFVLVLALGASVAAGQETQRDTTFVLPEITVEDERAPFYGSDVAAHVSRFDQRILETAGERTVGGALSRLSGVFVRQYGATGSSGVTLRGTGTGQTAVLLDGLPVESPQLGQVDLSLLPVSMLSGIEVLHGGASSLVGSGAVGGAINLRSVDPDALQGLQFSSSAGAWGERMLSGRMAAGGDRIRAVLAAEVFTRRGDFPYTDHASFPAARRHRENADGSAQNAFGKLVVARHRSTFEIAAWFTHADRGLPGLAGSARSDERQKDQIGRLWIRYASSRTSISASSHWSRLTYSNPALDIKDTGRSTTTALTASRLQPLGSGVQADVSVELSAGFAEHPALRSDADQYGLRASMVGRVDRGDVSIHPSLRLDGFLRNRGWLGQLSPGLRLRFDRIFGTPFALKSGLVTSFRAPTFNDLFWRGQGAVGNEDLQAERGMSYDLGGELLASTFTLEVSGFFQRVRNQITWSEGESRLWSPENVGRVRTIGIEAAARKSIAITSAVVADAEARYTYTDSRDRTYPGSSSFDKPVRHVPAHLLNAGISSTWRFLELGVRLRHTSRRYVTVDASEWLRGHTVADAHVSTRVDARFARVEMTLFVENLGAGEYQIMSGYPMPPRHARLQLTVTLK